MFSVKNFCGVWQNKSAFTKCINPCQDKATMTQWYYRTKIRGRPDIIHLRFTVAVGRSRISWREERPPRLAAQAAVLPSGPWILCNSLYAEREGGSHSHKAAWHWKDSEFQLLRNLPVLCVCVLRRSGGMEREAYKKELSRIAGVLTKGRTETDEVWLRDWGGLRPKCHACLSTSVLLLKL